MTCWTQEINREGVTGNVGMVMPLAVPMRARGSGPAETATVQWSLGQGPLLLRERTRVHDLPGLGNQSILEVDDDGLIDLEALSAGHHTSEILLDGS